MSYETHPILNRIKIRKGWKNPYFPFKTLNYSQEITLWFKLYLLLKNYLFLQKIMVLACEIRLSENHQKILYLSVTKQFRKKKFPKSKWKSKSLLQDSKSLLTKISNKKARFLLYQDLKTLKKNSSFFLNQTQKKILLKAWGAKPRFSSWINLSKSIYKRRQKTKRKLYLTWKKKKYIFFHKNTLIISNKPSFKNLVEKELFSKHLFWQRKQKKLLTLLSKTQKELFFIEKNLSLISYWKIACKTELRSISKIQNIFLNNLFITLRFKYINQKLLLEKTQNLYTHLLNNIIFTKEENFLQKNLLQKSWKLIQSRKFQQQRRKIQLQIFWQSLKKQFWVLQVKNISFSNKEKLFTIWKSIYFKRTQKYHLINTAQHFIFSAWFILCDQKIQNLITKSFFLPQKNQTKFIYKIFLQDLWKQNSQLLGSFSKTKFIEKRTKILPWHLLQLLRFKQKVNTNFLKKKRQYKLQFNKTFKLLPKNPKNNLHLNYQYRLPVILLYKNNLTLTTGFQLKYLLQNVLHKYFDLQLMVKISWPLIQFKNLKFYRLLFPNYNPDKSEHNSQQNVPFIKRNEKKSLKRNRYLYVGQLTKHFQLNESFFHVQQKALTYTKLQTISKIVTKQSKRMVLYGLDLKESKPKKPKNKKKTNSKPIFLHKFQQKPLKKNPYLLLKSKILQKKSQKRLFWASKTLDIGNFLTTVTLFSKYLNPQPLAEHLAKLINQSKNHSSVVKFTETLLHTVQMKRGVGYRIALIGRLDGANKSRTLCLKKLNRNRARQTFSKNVTFAMAHARASIGVFSIKIWVYS
jgi:hypothetical protein